MGLTSFLDEKSAFEGFGFGTDGGAHLAA